MARIARLARLAFPSSRHERSIGARRVFFVNEDYELSRDLLSSQGGEEGSADPSF
jgi:hypothetical protein